MTKENVQEAKKDFYNFVIIGAGPAGLTAGITATKLGFKAIIIEKGARAGPKPRGEGMRYYPLIDEILGNQFLQSICHRKTPGGQVFHSPGNLKKVKITKSPGFFFEWREFIDGFEKIINDLDVEILLNSEVIDPIVENNVCIGVKFRNKSGEIKEIYGDVILDCSGHVGVIGKLYGISYENEINCPIIKCLVSNGNIDIEETPCLQFYFIGNGDLDYSPEFPQCVAYIFPIGGTNMEVGLMLRMTHAREMKTVKIPSETEIMNVWSKLKESYPGFSEFFKGAKIDYEELTAISNCKMVENLVPLPGVVLIGESAGFVDPFGSSGLYFSMAMAKFWVTMLSNKLDMMSKRTKVIPISEIWSSENIKEYKEKFEDFETYKEIKNSYNLIGAFEYKIFRRLRTAEKINNKWDWISTMLVQAANKSKS
jgi:flavin-dependent dehydrogenase